METQHFTLSRGTSPILRFRLVVPENVTDWITQFALYTKPTATTALLTKSGVITTAIPNAALVGVIDVALTAAETRALNVRDYHYTFARTNAGFEALLTTGTVTVQSGIIT